MKYLKRKIDEPYDEDTDLTVLFRRKLSFSIRIRRKINELIGKLTRKRRDGKWRAYN